MRPHGPGMFDSPASERPCGFLSVSSARTAPRLARGSVIGYLRAMTDRRDEPSPEPDHREADHTDPASLSDDLRHDAVARWWIESFGNPPSPEERVAFGKRIESDLAFDEDKWLGDDLIKGDPDKGIKPYDPDEEARIAALRGIDYTVDPDWRRLKELTEEARKRKHPARSRSPDLRAMARAASFKEEREAERERRKKEVARKGSPSSRRSRESWRRDQKRDLAILKEIKGFFGADIGVRLAPSRPALVRLQKEIHEASKTPTDHSEPMIVVPHWEKTTLPLRVLAMSVGAGKLGARDFTLHLSDDVLDYALGGDGQSFAKRMLRRLKDSLALEYGKVGMTPPDFLFQVERGRGEKPHIHGVIIAPDDMPLVRLRAALRKAGGDPWKKTPHVPTQVDIGELPEPVGWVGYIIKFAEITKKDVGDNTFAATLGMRAIGKDWYQRARMIGELLLPGKATPI